MLFMDGALIIDKPAGLTSHDVVARVRRIIGERRVGHTGTLDPFATGVLVVLVGRATRLAQFLSGAEKEYEATVRLGYATDTGDLTGTRVPIVSHRGQQNFTEKKLRRQWLRFAAISSRPANVFGKEAGRTEALRTGPPRRRS
jgi:tRNA pseudouridine55 synthase